MARTNFPLSVNITGFGRKLIESRTLQEFGNYVGLSTVSYTGAYSDLTDKPTLFSGAYADLTGKPTLFSGAYADLTDKPALFSGAYSDLTGKPTLGTMATENTISYTPTSGLAAVALSNNYADLTGKPTLFSGSYIDLTDKPTLGTMAAENTTSYTPTSGLSAVAISNNYSDLSGKPTLGSLSSLNTIGTTQVDADAITYAKIQNVSSTDRLLGRVSAGAGDIEEVTCTDFAQSLLDDADASTARTTLGLGSLATQSGTFSGTSSGTNTGDQNIFSTISVQGQSNVIADSTSDTLTFVAGSNVTIETNATEDSITIHASGSSSNSFSTISVSGQSDVVADSSTDTLTLVAGSNITITTNAGTDTITIAATGGGSGLTLPQSLGMASLRI